MILNCLDLSGKCNSSTESQSGKEENQVDQEKSTRTILDFDPKLFFYLKRRQESFCGIQSSGFEWQSSKANLSREYSRSLRGSLSAALTKFLEPRNLHCSERLLGEL